MNKHKQKIPHTDEEQRAANELVELLEKFPEFATPTMAYKAAEIFLEIYNRHEKSVKYKLVLDDTVECTACGEIHANAKATECIMSTMTEAL